MRVVGCAVVLVAAASIVVACATYGDDPSTPANDGGTATTTSSGASGTNVDGGATDPDSGTVPPAPALACPSAGRSCVAEPPGGWNGPLIVYDGSEDSVPSCPPEMNEAQVNSHRGYHPPVTAHTCSSCSCLPGSGVTCTVTLTTSDSDCAAGPTGSTTLAPNTCTPLPPSTAYAVEVKGTGGACSPNGGFPNRPPIPWDSRTRGCGASTLLRTGCPSGEICTPDPPFPFRAKHCIYRKGDHDCPGAPYTEQVLMQDVDDQRACTACECGPPENNCTANGAKWSTPNCAGIPQLTQFPIACTAQGNVEQSLQLNSATSIAPKCEPTKAAQPFGNAAPGPYSTLCCIP